jgi:hypothetical protein
MATEVIKTIKIDGTGDYTSLAAFESGEQRDLVALDEIAVAEVYDNQEVNYLDLSGWVMDSVHRMIVRIPTINGVYDPTYYHHGKEDQGVKLDKTGASYMFVIRSGHYLSVYGFEITMSAGGNYNPFYKEGTSGSSMYDCVLHNMQYGAYCNEVAQNCLIYDFGRSSSGGAYAGSYNGKTINCTIYADGNSGAYNGQIIVRSSECYNTVIYNTTTGGYDNFYSCTGDYNASNDTSAPGSNSIDNITLSEIGWTSVVAGSEDLHIGSASLLIDAGIGHNFNSDIPITDIAGNERGLDICAIGAFEFVNDIPTEIINLIFSAENNLNFEAINSNLKRNLKTEPNNQFLMETIFSDLTRNLSVKSENEFNFETIQSQINNIIYLSAIISNTIIFENINPLITRNLKSNSENNIEFESAGANLNRNLKLNSENHISFEDIHTQVIRSLNLISENTIEFNNILCSLKRYISLNSSNDFLFSTITSNLTRNLAADIENEVVFENIATIITENLYLAFNAENNFAFSEIQSSVNRNLSVKTDTDILFENISAQIIRNLRTDIQNRFEIEEIIANAIRNLKTQIENEVIFLDIQAFISTLIRILEASGLIEPVFSGKIEEIYHGTIK